MDAKATVQEYIDRARKAQKIFEGYSQEKVDEAVRAVGKIIFDNAEPLAKMAVEETGYGLVESKIAKNKGKASTIWAKMKGVKSRNIVGREPGKPIIDVLKPLGVLGAITPVTNPTATPLANAMCALKGGNAVIVCPHPNAKKTGIESVNLMRKALQDVGAPVDLIQVITNPTLEASQAVMALCDCCISTGGSGMVKAAYSSGKPAFGVGQGNIQCLVDDDAVVAEVVPKIITGRTYDQGILCTCEQSMICHEKLYDQVIDEMKKQGVYYVEDPAEIDRLRKVCFPDGKSNKALIGRPAQEIGKEAGIQVPADTRMFMVKCEKCGADELFAKEKLFPVMAGFKAKSWEDAVAIALKNLLNEGAGHSCVFHSHNQEHIEYAAKILPVCRFSINQIGSNSCGGTFKNGLDCTLTLGCGSWGNNSLSGNLWWTHLVNTCRIAYEDNDVKIPTQEEIWAE